ncbi:MAG: tRNA1(Val) (adenine(37)-N6)-methyltransferase [Bacteroidota bacterium]
MKTCKSDDKKHIFRFKQFSVTDNNCGQKIGTDGVLLGSIASVQNCSTVLDIGTGSGIIALMIAQKQDALIDAIEIDSKACIDAHENINNSKWRDKISLHNISFQDFAYACNKKYDLIVCNPPFFHNSLKSNDIQRDVARHSDLLPLKELFARAKKLLTDSGSFLLITPANQNNIITDLARIHALHIIEKWIIKPNPDKEAHRIINALSLKTEELRTKEISIETGRRHEYTVDYKELAKDYYLNM